MTNIANVFEQNENKTLEQQRLYERRQNTNILKTELNEQELYLIQTQDSLIRWVDKISTYLDRLEDDLTRNGELIDSHPLINEVTDMSLYEDQKILYETFSDNPKEGWELLFKLEEDSLIQ
ncbi:MAG: hypothetical protein U9R34_01635 [Nanoarchaeota archaeon]|nr:hypothetical protein [Nanoarchaeota archaeon]